MDNPIKIKIEDNRKFCDVALLIDRKDFREDISKIRKDFGVHVFHGSLSEWERLPFKGSKISDIAWDDLVNREDTKKREKWLKQTIEASKKSLPKHVLQSKIRFSINRLAENLRKKYGCPSLMVRVIEACILCDQVTDEDYSLARISFERSTSIPEFGVDDPPPLVIEITPFTRQKDVVRELKKKDQFKKDYLALFSGLSRALDKGTVSNIKRDREWYWVKELLPNLTYRQMAVKVSGKDRDAYQQAAEGLNNKKLDDEKKREYYDYRGYILSLEKKIKQAVYRYRKKLKVPRKFFPTLGSYPLKN